MSTADNNRSHSPTGTVAGRPPGRPTYKLTYDMIPINVLFSMFQEDALLTKLIAMYGTKNWSIVAAGIKGRSGKSCRLRWVSDRALARRFRACCVILLAKRARVALPGGTTS